MDGYQKNVDALKSSLKELLAHDFSIKQSFKVDACDWVGEISLMTYGDGYIAYGAGRGMFDFDEIDEAIDFFLTIYYNIDNYCLLFRIAEKYKFVEDANDLGYINRWKKEEVTELMDKCRAVFYEEYPLAKELNNAKALENIRLARADWDRNQEEYWADQNGEDDDDEES